MHRHGDDHRPDEAQRGLECQFCPGKNIGLAQRQDEDLDGQPPEHGVFERAPARSRIDPEADIPCQRKRIGVLAERQSQKIKPRMRARRAL